jgi:hypothetical protein
VSIPQALFLLDQRRETVYGGAARGGKSDALLAAALQYVDLPGYAALILRRTFPELRGADGLLARAMAWLTNTDAVWHEQTRTWTFPSGAILEFGHVETEQSKYNYDGRAYQFVGFDELTSFTETQYDHIGFTRTSPQVKVPAPLRTRGSCTPTNVGFGWVKRRFISNRADDVAFIPAKVSDNPGVDPLEYAKSLARVPEALRKRLLDGDWDAFEGAAFPDFDESVHVVEAFEVPNEWDRFECMDFGVSNPTAWLLVAVDYDGNLIVSGEHYAPGLPSDTAPVILALRKAGWEQRNEDGWKTQTNRVWADPSIRNTVGIGDRFGNKTSVMQEFADLGVGGLVPANNDRQAGFLRLAELIRRDFGDEDTERRPRRFPAWHPLAGEHGSPRVFIQKRCPNLIEQLRAAPLEVEGKPLFGEAIAGDWESREGHAVAAARYGFLSRPGPSKEPVPEITDPREALIARRMARRERAQHDYERSGDLVDCRGRTVTRWEWGFAYWGGVWILLGFLVAELAGYFGVAPWPTFSETVWHSIRYPLVGPAVFATLVFLAVHFIYHRPVWHSLAFGLVVAFVAHWLDHRL